MKPSEKEIKDLQQKIDHDQKQPPKPAEKRVRVEQSFSTVVTRMSETPPQKN
jgi:hypothetical protein